VARHRHDGEVSISRAEVYARDPAGGLKATDKGNLTDGAELRRVSHRLAEKLRAEGIDADPAELEAKLSAEWPKKLDQLLRELEEAEADPPAPAPPEAHGPDGSRGLYKVEGGRICRRRCPPGGPDYFEPLCNFQAAIVREEVLDDGSGENRHTFTVEGRLDDGSFLPAVSVPGRDFAAMNWPLTEWGLQAVVFAGQGARDHLRVAIQEMSRAAKRCRIYKHTGWRRDGEAWLYLHAAGAIGPEGSVATLRVELDGKLAQFRLPDPPTGKALARAIRADLHFLEFARPGLMYPLLGAVYRAALGPADFSLALVGKTGRGKSELCALAQQHEGADMNRLNLPGNWLSTATALEGLAFLAKDALLVIDDFRPGGSRSEIDSWHAKAERVLRAQGNASGRQRCWADGTVRAERPPRGLILLSGEDLPRGESLRARNLALQVRQDDFPITALTPLQQDAAAGLYAQALAGFLRWLAPQYAVVRSQLPGRHADLRREALGAETHPRTPGIVADLQLGLNYFLDFARARGVIDEEEREQLVEDGWQALLEAAADQVLEVQAQDPARRFLDLVAAVITSGRAHLASRSGTTPEKPDAWGWREVVTGAGQFARCDWHPQGQLLGWVDGEGVYLEPEGAYALAQRFGEEQGERLPLSQGQLFRRLKEQKLLASWNPDRSTTHRSLQGKNRKVLHLHSQTLYPLEESVRTVRTGDGE
jgi:hypothetical protein